MLSARQKQIKPHLLSTVDAQSSGVDAHDVIKKTSIVLHVSRLLANSTCIQSLVTSEQPLRPKSAITLGAKCDLWFVLFQHRFSQFSTCLSSHEVTVPLTFLTKVCSV